MDVEPLGSLALCIPKLKSTSSHPTQARTARTDEFAVNKVLGVSSVSSGTLPVASDRVSCYACFGRQPRRCCRVSTSSSTDGVLEHGCKTFVGKERNKGLNPVMSVLNKERVTSLVASGSSDYLHRPTLQRQRWRYRRALLSI